jgi:hypothetical protein
VPRGSAGASPSHVSPLARYGKSIPFSSNSTGTGMIAAAVL